MKNKSKIDYQPKHRHRRHSCGKKIVFPFYILWHLFWGMLIAYAIAFIILHHYSMNPYLGLNFFEQIWRTISYVIPKWHSLILPPAALVMVFSLVSHGFIRSWQTGQSGWAMGAYTVLMLLGSSFILILFHIASPFIVLPVLLESLLLNMIDKVWDRQFAEKPKRKNDEESKGTA